MLRSISRANCASPFVRASSRLGLHAELFENGHAQLLHFRIILTAGVDPLPSVVGLRRWGVTWELIARAAGVSRQAAHERWGRRVLEVLDAYGTGELGGPVADDETDLR